MNGSAAPKNLDPETRKRLEAAVRELFSQKDFHQVNMRCIAQKTGIGLNTIYLHYESKERLLFYFVSEWIQNLDNRLAEHLQGLEDIREKIRKTIWVMLDFYEKNPDIATIVILTVPFKTWIADETFTQKDLAKRVIDLFREGREKGLLDQEASPELMFDILYGIIHRLVYIWLYLNKKESLTANARKYGDMIWRAIENPDHKKSSS